MKFLPALVMAGIQGLKLLIKIAKPKPGPDVPRVK